MNIFFLYWAWFLGKRGYGYRTFHDHQVIIDLRSVEFSALCCVDGCKEHVIACSKMITEEKSAQRFEDAGLVCSSHTIPVPTPLCSHHYHLLYNRLHPTPTNCSTCDSTLKNSTPRHCPDPLVIQSI